MASFVSTTLPSIDHFSRFQPVPLPSASKPTRRSPFLHFVMERTPALRTDPSMLSRGKDGQDKFDVTKMAKALGAEWRQMSDSEKSVRSWLLTNLIY